MLRGSFRRRNQSFAVLPKKKIQLLWQLPRRQDSLGSWPHNLARLRQGGLSDLEDWLELIRTHLSGHFQPHQASYLTTALKRTRQPSDLDFYWAQRTNWGMSEHTEPY
jgi:hypothetical protein